MRRRSASIRRSSSGRRRRWPDWPSSTNRWERSSGNSACSSMRRGGLVGLGNVAVHGHLPFWMREEKAQIVAVTDVRPAQRHESERLLPAARWYDSPLELMADPTLDFIDVCTPPSSHAELIRAALDHGLHVLCEKPLLGSLDEFRALAAQAAESRRVFHIVHNWHQAPIIRRASALLAQGAIGRLRGITWHTLRIKPAAAADGSAANWRLDPRIAGGGVLLDHGWHVSYLLRRWMGAAPSTIRARLERRRHTGSPVEDTAELWLTFPDGTAEVLLTWAADVRGNWAELRGTEGRLELRDDTLVLERAGQERRWLCPPGLSTGSQHPDWFEPVAREFLSESAGGPAGANLAEVAVCVGVQERARESSRCGGEALPLQTAELARGAGVEPPV